MAASKVSDLTATSTVSGTDETHISRAGVDLALQMSAALARANHTGTLPAAAGALLDSECTSLADVKALDQSVVSGSAPTIVGTNITGLGAGAGALLDSECTSLADVKALDQSVISGASPTFDAANITGLGFGGVDTDLGDLLDIGIGIALDSPAVTVASNGTVITLSVEKSGGGNIRVMFSTGVYDWVTAPDTVTLTEGSDTSPTLYYVYLLESDKTLYAQSSWPSAEHAPVATVVVQTAASLQTDGAYKVHAWTDHSVGSDGMGHLAHLNSWIRQQPATWVSGCALNTSVGASTFDIDTEVGVVLQLHNHAFPAFDTDAGSQVFIVNHPDTAYRPATDLTQTFVDKDANGTTLGGGGTDFYNLVIWGVVSEDSGDCQLMCNVPDGAYNNDNNSKATLDDDKTAVYDIPEAFTGCGFLIARLTVQENSGTYTIENNESLLGQLPGTAAGGGSTGGNEFSDAAFRIQDSGDATAELDFDCSDITTGTTRTLTVQDKDGTIAVTSDLVETIAIACSDETTDLTTGNGKATFTMPYAMTVTEVMASVVTAPVGATMEVDINNGGTTIMATHKLDILTTAVVDDNTATVSSATLAKDAVIRIDIDVVGVSTKGAGLKVYITGTRT